MAQLVGTCVIVPGRSSPLPLEHARAHGVPQALIALAQAPPNVPVPDALNFDDRLMPHQRDGARQVIKMGGRCLVADEMGLGKTCLALAVAKYYGESVLVICPAYLQRNWEAEALHWLDQCVSVTIMSYEVAARRANEHSFTTIICDEAHYLKNHRSKRCEMLTPLLHRTKRVLLLTGSPCQVPVELFALVRILRPQFAGSYDDWARRYCARRPGRYVGFDDSGISRSKELSWLLRCAIMVRRTKQELDFKLPSKTRHWLTLELPKHERVAQEELFEQLEDARTEQQKNSIMSKMLQHTCDAKLQCASAMVLPGRAVYFAQHLRMLDALEEHVPQCARIDGSMSTKRRHDVIAAFERGEHQALVLSLAACATGITLVSCCTVVFCELHWSSSVLAQAEDRVHRIGQKHPVNVHYWLAEGTIDELIVNSVYRKQGNAKKILMIR